MSDRIRKRKAVQELIFSTPQRLKRAALGSRPAPKTLGGQCSLMGGVGAGLAAAKVMGDRYKKNKTNGIRNGKVYNEGTGGQYSIYKEKPRRCYLPKHVEDALPPQVVVNQQAYQLKSAVAQQAIVIPLLMMQPGLGTGATGDKISNTLYVRATGDVTINNIYLSNAYVIIYDIVCRKDIGVSAISNPQTAWQQGAVDESATNAEQKLGSTPWQSEAFNQYYKVKQVTNVVLAAGGTHVHKVRIEPNRLVNSSYGTYTQYGFKDLTYFTMIEVHGSPANDTTTQTQVSIGAGGLNIITDFEQTYKIIAKQTPTIYVTNSLGTFTVGEQVVNLGGSTIVPQAEG